MTLRIRSAFGSRPVRFAVVGVAAAALFFVLVYLFVSVGMTPFAGTVVAYGIAFAAAYAAQRAWTFGARHRHGHALPRYFIVQLGCALMSGILAQLLVTYLQMPPLIMSAVTAAAASVASYFLSSRWAFAEAQGR